MRGHKYMFAILNGHPQNCKDLFRMEVEVYRVLCSLIRSNGYVHGSW